MDNNAQNSAQNLGHLVLCPIFNVRKSKNLETSSNVLFFLTREISSENQIKNQNFEIEEFFEAFYLKLEKTLLKFRQFKAKLKFHKFENEVIFFLELFFWAS
jgi:hypothetical protein